MQTPFYTINQSIQKLVKHFYEQKVQNTKENCIELLKNGHTICQIHDLMIAK